MPLQEPNASNGYLVHPDHTLTPDFVQALLTGFHERFNAIELVTTQVQSVLSDENSSLLQEAFDNTLVPLLAQLGEEVATISQAIETAENKLAAITTGGVAGENISLVAIDGLAAGDAQAGFAELNSRIETLAQTVATLDFKPLESFVLDEATLLKSGKIYVLDPLISTAFLLPVSPTVGEMVRVIDGDTVSDEVSVSLISDAPIGGKASPYIIKSGDDLTFIYLSSGWKRIGATGASGSSSYATSVMFN